MLSGGRCLQRAGGEICCQPWGPLSWTVGAAAGGPWVTGYRVCGGCKSQSRGPFPVHLPAQGVDKIQGPGIAGAVLPQAPRPIGCSVPAAHPHPGAAWLPTAPLSPASEEEQGALPRGRHHQLPGPLCLPGGPPGGLRPLSAAQVRWPWLILLLAGVSEWASRRWGGYRLLERGPVPGQDGTCPHCHGCCGGGEISGGTSPRLTCVTHT